MMKNVILLVSIFVFLCYSVVCQPSSWRDPKYKDSSYVVINNQFYHKDSINFLYDPLDLGFKEYIATDCAFLVDDTTYHDYKVLNIQKLKKGYFISLSTELYDTLAYVKVVSLKEKSKYHQKIKKGKTYRMKLVRYFERPLERSIEYKQTYDVMVGEKSVGILSTGRFTYLFLSQNIEGLSYIDSATIAQVEYQKQKIKENLQQYLFEVVKAITFKEDSEYLLNYIDTSLVKKSLKKYSKLSKGYSPSSPTPINLPELSPLSWENFNISTKTFKAWFWGMLKCFYDLPESKNEQQKEVFSPEDVDIKILYLSNNIYTVRVKWKLFSEKFPYYAVFIVKENKDEFKVIGFNKVW